MNVKKGFLVKLPDQSTEFVEWSDVYPNDVENESVPSLLFIPKAWRRKGLRSLYWVGIPAALALEALLYVAMLEKLGSAVHSFIMCVVVTGAVSWLYWLFHIRGLSDYKEVSE